MSICHVARSRGVVLALALVATLVVSALVPPAQAKAQTPLAPMARLQFVVKQVTIHDDNEGIFSGDGEMELYTGIWRCKPGYPPPCRGSSGEGYAETLQRQDSKESWSLARGARLLNAGSGDTVTLDQVVPGLGDLMWWDGTAPELGIAIYDDEQYVI